VTEGLKVIQCRSVNFWRNLKQDWSKFLALFAQWRYYNLLLFGSVVDSFQIFIRFVALRNDINLLAVNYTANDRHVLKMHFHLLSSEQRRVWRAIICLALFYDKFTMARQTLLSTHWQLRPTFGPKTFRLCGRKAHCIKLLRNLFIVL
jgi:hypothetical protein